MKVFLGIYVCFRQRGSRLLPHTVLLLGGSVLVFPDVRWLEYSFIYAGMAIFLKVIKL